MKYSDGREVKVGDRVELWSGCFGIVVCSFDDNVYTTDFSEQDWGYLRTGVLIKTGKAGLIHYIESDEDILLLARENQLGSGE